MFHIFAVQPLYVLSGLIVGGIVGVTGVGGGSLMTPLLVLLFGIHPATAVGTDLLYAATTKSAGSLVHGFNKVIQWRVVALLAAGSVPAAAATLYVLAHVGVMGAPVSEAISLVLGVMLIITAISLFFRRRLLAFAGRRAEPEPRRQAVLTVLTGLVIGVLVSISSVGAGAIGVTILMLLYPRLPALRIVGTDIAHAVPLTLVAGIGHWALGSVDWGMLGSLLIGSVPGIVLTSHFAPKLHEGAVRMLLGTILSIVGIRLMLS